MRWFALFVFVGVFISRDVTPLKAQRYPSNLAWLFGLNNKVNENNKEETRTVCQTEECKKIAKVMLESMDKSADPCDDFYEYACGKWAEHNPVPEGSRSWSLWHMLQKNVDRQIENILKEGPKDNDLLAVKLAKKWYAACMDTDAMNKRGLEPLVSTLSRMGGWPMIMDPDEWDEQEYSWQKVDDQYVRLMGRNAFHDVLVYDYNETETVVRIDTPHLPPGAVKLWALSTLDSDEVNDESDANDESDEDPSDEEKQSDEESQEPGSEGENDDDDDDNGDNINEQDNDQKAKNKESTDKFSHNYRKNKKSIHSERKSGNGIIKKHKKSQTEKKQRLETRAITTKINSKRPQRFTHRDKLNGRKRTKKASYTVHASTTPRFSTERTNDDYEGMMRQRYADYISKVAHAIAKERGMKVSKNYIDEDIEDLIEFQFKLTEITMESGEDLELTLDDFQNWYDEKGSKTDNNKVDWVYKITELFDEANVAVDGYLDITVDSPDYFGALASLLDETASRTIVNYIHWNFLSKIIKTTTSEMRELYDAWEEVDDDEEREPRSSQCIREVEMSDILAYEYVRKHFSDDIAKTAMDMIDDIQKEVEYLIKESDWMDDDTKDFVLSKLINMDKLIGYPDWYKNSTIVKRYFQGLIIGKSYYENTLSYLRYYKWNKLRKLTQDDEALNAWWISPVTLNALFDPEGNSIAITAADFQSPLFAYGRPQTINFGIIGFIMAHEVNHGFDDTGHLYNKNGDFMEWLSTMAEAYGKRAECFVEQFNNYPIDKASNKKLKNYGNQTAGENIADTMGLQTVFRAYRRRERECAKPDAVLPGLEGLTNDQLFFLSFGNLWCESTNSTTTMRDAKMDSHSTGRLRVIGSVSNSEDFAKAYNCPAGSAMNPEKKCNIWK